MIRAPNEADGNPGVWIQGPGEGIPPILCPTLHTYSHYLMPIPLTWATMHLPGHGPLFPRVSNPLLGTFARGRAPI